MKSYNGFNQRQRMAGYNWLMAQYAAGTRQPPARCDACLVDEGLIQPHSEDYSAPHGDHIGRYGLCYRCHMILHCRFSAPTAFEAYAAELAAGRRFPPLPNKQWGTFSRDHLGRNRLEATIAVGYKLPGFVVLLEEGQRVLSSRESPGPVAQLSLPLEAAGLVEGRVVRQDL